MLRPRDTSTRERKNLNGLWQFALDRQARVDPASGSRDRPGAREMAVPASFNDIAADAAVRDYFGDIWYQTSVWIPRGWQDGASCSTSSPRPTAPRCGSTTTKWSHTKADTPFEADITEHVTGGEQVRITAVVNNTLSFQSIPPGVIEDTPAGKRQIYWHDFFNYAGIHRTVWLYSTDPAHVTDVTIVTDLDGQHRCSRLHDRRRRSR